MAKDKLTYRVEPSVAPDAPEEAGRPSTAAPKAGREAPSAAPTPARPSAAETRPASAGVTHATAKETPRAEVAVEAPSSSAGATAAGTAGSAPETSGQAGTSAASPAGAGQAWPGRAERLLARLDRLVGPNRHAVAGGLCGLLVAILIFTIGIDKTLVIVVLVTVGVACGQFIDGDPKLARMVQSLLRRR